MGRIRPFAEADVAQVASLHRAVFRPGARTDSAGLESDRHYFTNVFLENPSREAELPSLVYEQGDGRILGFLGVVPRRMSLNGRPLQAAISTQFVVNPGCSLAAVGLARTFLEGPQDLSLSDEANDAGRRIWEALGGTTALLHSIYWTRPLRPAGFALECLRGRRSIGVLGLAGRAPAWIVDQLATWLPRSQFYQSSPPVSEEDLRAETLLAILPEFADPRTLRVDYDDSALAWLLERASRRKAGRLVKALIRNGPAIVGWYLYHLDPRGLADVLQLAASPSFVPQVLDQLFYSAWRRGAVAATGRMDPRFLQALSDKYCLFHRRGPWMLVKATRPELLRPFDSGDALFSRFDGEWCLGY